VRQSPDNIQLLAEVFNNMYEGIVIVNEQGVIEMINPAFTNITGYSFTESIGYKLKELIARHHEPEFFGCLKSFILDRGRWIGTATYKRKNGGVYFAAASVNIIRDEINHRLQYVVVFHDITEMLGLKKEREELLEQNARVKRLSSLTAMSAGVVHEIAQPLNAIKVAADGVLYRYRNGYSLNQSEVFQKMEEISREASKIGEIIHHMRDFASIAQVSELIPCDINKTVKTVLSMMGRQLSSHGIDVIIKLAEQLPLVLASPTRLEEVIINLLANAMHALDEVDRSEKQIVCTTSYEANIILEVSDNAAGIDIDIKDKIFEPFFTTRRSGEGMGMGLSVVQSILESLQGKIESYNNDMGGASFKVELMPLAGTDNSNV
jgi:PAS domain S-box-containing protein